MNTKTDELDTAISRSVELEEQLFTLLGETNEAFELIRDLSHTNFLIGRLWGQQIGKGV